MTDLFSPIKIGSISSKNRILMAPLTRTRNHPDGVPTALMAEYYSQRAEAGVIVAEATSVCFQGMGFLCCPGIWMDQQIAGWKRVTDAVHAKGGKIVCQLWHGGRIVMPTMVGGLQPVSASAGTAPGEGHTWEGKAPYSDARELTIPEIKTLVEQFAVAAKNAISAGFDGVQVHCANGYLLDQFLRDSTNKRSDQYGGSVENRIRLIKEVCEAVIAEVGAEKTWVRVSPNGEILGCIDSNPASLFVELAKTLQKLNVACLAVKENTGNPDQPNISSEIRKVFTNTLVLNGGYNGKTAQADIVDKKADAIAFGRDFMANPDLVAKIKEGKALTPQDSTTWYGQFLTDKSKGYTDY